MPPRPVANPAIRLRGRDGVPASSSRSHAESPDAGVMVAGRLRCMPTWRPPSIAGVTGSAASGTSSANYRSNSACAGPGHIKSQEKGSCGQPAARYPSADRCLALQIAAPFVVQVNPQSCVLVPGTQIALGGIMSGPCPSPAGTRFLTVFEVASIMRVSKQTVYRLVRGGHLEAAKVRGAFRIPDHALRSREHPPAVRKPGT
jgi:excisionase family DNA binding protein